MFEKGLSQRQSLLTLHKHTRMALSLHTGWKAFRECFVWLTMHCYKLARVRRYSWEDPRCKYTTMQRGITVFYSLH